MKLLTLLFLSACGCQDPNPFPKLPYQDLVVSSIWNDTYNMKSKESSPPIKWIDQKDLNCGGGLAFYIFNPTKLCVYGVTDTVYYVSVVAHPNDFVYHESALAHELAHASLLLRTGNADINHMNFMFMPGGTVDQANAILQNLGY